MAITYEDAIKAQQEIEDKALLDPNVVSVGVVAERDAFGKQTGNYAVQVGVISIDAYSRTHDHGESVIPDEVLIHSDQENEDKHIRITIVKEGKIEALNATPIHEKQSEIPSAIDDLPETTSTTHRTTLKHRPSLCGYSISHSDISAGTLGLLLEYTEEPHVGKAFILSNNHVIAANNTAFAGDKITQPGSHDFGRVDTNTIATLHRWILLQASTFNYVDAAIALVCGGNNWRSFVSPYIKRIGQPTEIVEPAIGMQVEKFGRTTEYTTGEIISTSFSTNIEYPMSTLAFKNQIQTTNMSTGGDSGCCIVKCGSRNSIGLLFAGSNTASYSNPMLAVLSALSQKHKNKYPSGKVEKFKADFPLQILRQQRRSYSFHARAIAAKISALSPAIKRANRHRSAAMLAASISVLISGAARKWTTPSQQQTSMSRFNLFGKQPIAATNFPDTSTKAFSTLGMNGKRK